MPDAPTRAPLPEAWSRQHGTLYSRLREALATLPFYFRTETTIAGINATDIFNLNAALGAAIEEQVVTTLNAMREAWDPDDHYALYGFVRQSQTFPDVLLRRMDRLADQSGVLLGIELKGWYLISKERAPSFRYTVTPQACAPQDLLVVVPWALSNVIGGSPRTFAPYVESARYAAEYRNHHWSHLRQARGDTGIVSPESVSPYPRKADAIADRAVTDGGGNFGRFARTGLMDDFIEASLQQTLSGIGARHWLAFFRAFQDQSTAEAADVALDRLATEIRAQASGAPQGRADALIDALRAVIAAGSDD